MAPQCAFYLTFSRPCPWDHFADPLELVRQRFNVLPRGREPEWPASITR